MEPLTPLATVHDALNNAVHAPKAKPGQPTSFRMEDELKDQTMDLCERHGTNLSEFIRQCCIALVRDYQVPPRG